MVGLLSPLATMNAWTLAEAAGEATPDRMQLLLNHSVVDETGFPKKGVKSARVQRQYSGTAGRNENRQLGVLAYASLHGRPLVDRQLYLPRGWCDDPARRDEAVIDPRVGFATKPALGPRMLDRAIATGLRRVGSPPTMPTARARRPAPAWSSTGSATSSLRLATSAFPRQTGNS
ncbi:transposase [Micromonospora carbonacea]|uniref:transposase n=1 Tax=Micromonospora carbonacea TaxID=47853 RepID=UPI00371EBBDA